MSAADEAREWLALFDERSDYHIEERRMLAGVLAELDQANAEIERLMRPRPDDKHPIEIRHGWLVESGYEPNFVPGYGYEPDTDAAPLMKLSDLPGWPGAELDAALAVIQQAREWVDELCGQLIQYCDDSDDARYGTLSSALVRDYAQRLARIVGGES